jgi:UDP-N-acetylglucosamine 2-epimerase (non-hydrolysing)
VIGTRPEAIKLAPLAHALEERGVTPTLIFTGQHPDLGPEDFGLSEFPSLHLRCPGRRDPHAHVSHVTATFSPLLREPPDLLVVQGDTSSALGAALAGFVAAIPVAHVEAGLRTHDPRLPWPEEEYRIAIDARADLLFAPTPIAAANLRAERVSGEVHITGNTSIDAVLAVEAKLPPFKPGQSGRPRILVTCHRRESWGEGLESTAAALIEIGCDAAIDLILHPNARVAEVMRAQLTTRRNVNLVGPCSHSELVRRIREADLILSDSGGIQEEAPTLGTPLLVLREKTERPEGVGTGNMLLVGTSTERIIAETGRLLQNPQALAAMSRRTFPYGDGRAAPRIATVIERWVKTRSAGP